MDFHHLHVLTVKIFVAPVGTAFGLPAEPSFHLVANPESQIPGSSLAESFGIVQAYKDGKAC